MRTASIDSVTDPIWLTLSSRALQAFFSMAVWMILGLVHSKSSPTICNTTQQRVSDQGAGTMHTSTKHMNQETEIAICHQASKAGLEGENVAADAAWLNQALSC